MKSKRLKLCSIFALAVVLVIALGSLIGVNVAKADRSVTVTGSSIFYTTGNAEVWAHEVPATEGEEGATSSYYSMFVLKSDSDSVNYRKNLAHNWFYNSNFNAAADEGEDNEEVKTLAKAEGYFNMEIGFELTDGKIPFDKYIVTFESQEFSQTKDGKTANYVIFYPNTDKTGVYAVISDDIKAELPQNPVSLGYDNIKIEFSKSEVGGEYTVTVSSAAGSAEGVFKNVGSTYAKYSSSSTTPVTPLSFKAEFAEGIKDYAKMAIYNLNGQSFALTGTRESDGHRTGGTVNDTVAPVLCLDKGVSFVQLGSEISFRYTVIDVLASSPSLTTSYFMLTKEQAANGEFNAEDYTNEELFRKVTDSDDQKMIPHVRHYIPASTDIAGTKFGTELEAKALVKVCLKLTDTTSSGGVSDYVMLDWFVDDEYTVTVNGQKYVAVAKDTEGVSYKYVNDVDKASDVDSTEWDNLVKEYQAAVAEASKDLLAGSKNYFYLPSAESLLKDNATKYADMTFSIYYNNGSQQQQSNKAANALSINISKAGRYVFTIFAADAASNQMYYYKDGEKVEFATGDIWNMFKEEEDSDFEDTRKYLPWFYFDVEASEISIEEPEEQDTAYVGSSYSPDSFDINGVSYKTTYSLYLFNNKEYANDHDGVALTYTEFMERKAELLKGSESRKWFTYIYATNELTEGTEEYEKYNDYAWNNSSPNFVPQDDNAFYLIECKVTSTEGGTQEAVAYMGIAAAPKVDPLKGEDTWVQDNMVSIILLCIAGLALVGIVLVVVIKPKEKGDLDEVPVEEPKKKNK